MKIKMMIGMVVMVAVGMFLTACGVNPIARVSPGLKASNVSMVRTSAPVPAPTNVSTAAVASLDQEEVIKQMLLKSEEAWNKHDIKVFLRYYSEDAQIMVGRERGIISKGEYANILSSLFDRIGTLRHRLVKVMSINELSATVEAEAIFYVHGNHEVILYKNLDLICHKGRWLIQRSVYE